MNTSEIEASLPLGGETLCQITEDKLGVLCSFSLEGGTVSTEWGSSALLLKLEWVLKSLYDHVLEVNDEIDRITLHGKSCGDFYVTDITANGVYLDTFLVEHLCEMFELKHMPVLDSAVQFKSGVLDLRHGCILKPQEVAFLPNGERVIVSGH